MPGVIACMIQTWTMAYDDLYSQVVANTSVLQLDWIDIRQEIIAHPTIRTPNSSRQCFPYSPSLF